MEMEEVDGKGSISYLVCILGEGVRGAERWGGAAIEEVII